MNTSSFTAEIAENAESLPGWKQEVNARLSAHRTRRGVAPDQQPDLPVMGVPAPAARAARVAARIAERYANVPTYSETLAAEAAKAARAAEAAAQAAREAQQAAQAVTDVLKAGAESGFVFEPQAEIAPAPASATPTLQYHVDPASLPEPRRRQPISSNPQQEIGFEVEPHPHVIDPLEEALVAPVQPLPARVLEFPRELVAARKARPRIAEGPLRDADPGQETAQLRIFEVESKAISHQPDPAQPAAEDIALPGWSTIRLDPAPRTMEEAMPAAKTTTARSTRTAGSRTGSHASPLSSRASREAASKNAGYGSLLSDMLPMRVAPFRDRLMAAFVDAMLILCAFVLFLAVFVACTAHPPSGKPALVAAAAALVGFIALYQWLFFTFAESTPGMRCAKIALCTFDDQNPGRKTLQHRVGALFLAALPLGLGFLWAFLDDDRLGWHDRMTRTYQRSYRS